MTEPLIEKLKNGTCPFTGRGYDCARCELDPEEIKMPSDTPGMYEVHMQFCITRFVHGQTTKKEMKQVANMFVEDDGSHPTPEYLLGYFRDLARFGVEVIPMCNCERFCFRHGCKGDAKHTGEVNNND